MLSGRSVTLLKLDIDSKEGALLHVATHMIERNLTEVRSILIGLGDFKAHMTAMGTRNWIPHPYRRMTSVVSRELVYGTCSRAVYVES